MRQPFSMDTFQVHVMLIQGVNDVARRGDTTVKSKWSRVHHNDGVKVSPTTHEHKTMSEDLIPFNQLERPNQKEWISVVMDEWLRSSKPSHLLTTHFQELNKIIQILDSSKTLKNKSS